MKKLTPGILAGTAVLALSVTTLQPAQANPAKDDTSRSTATGRPDNRPGPLTERQDTLRRKALDHARQRLRPAGEAAGRRRHREDGQGPEGGHRLPHLLRVPREQDRQGLHGPLAVRRHRPGAQPDRPARPHAGQLDLLGAELRQGPLRLDVQRQRRVVQQLLPAAVERPVHAERDHRGLGHRARRRRDVRRQLGRGLRRRVGVHRRHRQRLVRRAEGGRQDRRPDRVLPRPVRPVGPLRLRRRRQLQRAGRLHRPLPGHPRRRGRGGRWRSPGRRRDLVAPLVRQPGRLRADRPQHRPVRRHPDRQHRHLDRRLHRRAGERRPRRVRPRVRPRPRAPGLLRHQRRREQHGVLDAHVVRLLARPRRRDQRGHRDGPGPDGSGGEVRAGLARLLRGRPRPQRDGQPGPGAAHLRRPLHHRERGGPGGQGEPARQDHDRRLHDPARGQPRLVVGPRRQPEQHAHPRRSRPPRR